MIKKIFGKIKNKIKDMKKFKKAGKKLMAVTLALTACYSAFSANTFAYENGSAKEIKCTDAANISYSKASEEDINVGSRFKDLIFGKGKKKQAEELYLCPGGDAFGVKIFGCDVTVSEVISELSSGALCVDDKIISIDGEKISSIKDVKEALLKSDGKEMTFEIMRKGKKLSIKITPKNAGGEYHLGVILSDGASGIGTVTYFDPETGNFGGLGHGICDKSGLEVLQMTHGEITGVILAGASKGEANKPGELRGVLKDKALGSLSLNTECGVFGNINNYDSLCSNKSEAIPVAKRGEIMEGEATIICTVKSGKRSEYKILLDDIDRNSTGTKSFRIKVTDESLIALTGGIVRGMSGSPIIQNGKLVGAVTHVLVGDPTEGYGIFIENMLSASENFVQPKAA